MKKFYPYILAFAVAASSCSERFYKQGVKNYEKLAYSEAIDDFQKYLQEHDKADAQIKLANSYRMMNDVYNAEIWFSKIVDLPESEPINMFHYGRLLMQVEKYDEAKIWFKKYLNEVPDDFVAEMLLVSCNSINTFMRDTTLYSVKVANIPEVANAFAQVPYKDGIIFSADKEVFKKGDTYNWTGKSYLDLYFSAKDESGRWLSPMLLKGNINGKYHEGPACFSKDGNTVYFTRNNVKKKKAVKNAKSENNLKIYRAELVGENWTNVTELPFNSDDYSCGHPSLSADGVLYFISDMPGGIGGTDIYKTSFDGTAWSKPENLGAVVNTSGNEMFPYIHQDGTFYFSSDAHNNLGGLDVFMTSYNGSRWLQVENLNYPLNTSMDDFAFVLNNDNKTGYLSSNRNSEDRIYEVSKHDPTFVLSGHVSHKGKPMSAIDSAVVEIYNAVSKEKEIILTDSRGNYKVKLKPGGDYKITSHKAMYFTVTPEKKISVAGKKYSENFNANFELDQIIIEKPIVLENIYYDLDKWFIRPDAATELDRLVEVLVENPKLIIELGSHTDSRAGDQYNLVLSDKRAKAAVEYLVSKGIDRSRMKYKGYGESKLVNRCKNNVECTEVEHQQNRRTEFKAIKGK